MKLPNSIAVPTNFDFFDGQLCTGVLKDGTVPLTGQWTFLIREELWRFDATDEDGNVRWTAFYAQDSLAMLFPIKQDFQAAA